MNTSKWEINKIGLIDFWYYDEEEFQFLDGRMLLRGANGSGKSVTMQSFIPLLLDGNKASERLDPFGTKARKLENYLLEENDDRQERTGYLYMEFKRKNSDTYLTIGIGLCARKNKKLDSWHFVINDGRRIGKDFFLYKDMKQKITLSKQELVHRLGEGGQVIEGQREYMKMVNDKLFGYETPEEYKELVDLLIQLRTPKLSKDFKPTVLNEILSSSLPPLSDDDLRPMSEAIENMDNLKAQLESLEESRKASEKILDVYRQYNECVLYEKAKGYVEAENYLQKITESIAELKKSQEKCMEQTEEQRKKESELHIEREAVIKQKADLDKNNLSELVEKKQKLQQELEILKNSEKEKKDSLEKKEDRERELQSASKTKSVEMEEKLDDLKRQLEEMESILQTISFDEHDFMAEELQQQIQEEYSFTALKGQVEVLRQRLKEGLEYLEEERKKREPLEAKEIAAEKIIREKADIEKKLEMLVDMSEQVKSEWIEKFYQWHKSNKELHLSDEQEQKIVSYMDGFTAKSDYAVIKEEIIRREKAKIETTLIEEHLLLKSEQAEAEDNLEKSRKQLEEWENKKDPEPERDEEVERNRQWLEQQGIEVQPFYKAIDFVDYISEEQKNRLEEALLHMGMLDALVVPEHFREKVLEKRSGMRDTYLFTSQNYVAQNLSEFLTISMEQEDILFYQQLSSLLMGMGTIEGENRIDIDGTYVQGLLHGTVAGEYQAKFIGVKAREAFRQEQIKIYQKEISERENVLFGIKNAFREKEEQLENLEQEFASLPKEEDVKEAVRDLADTQSELDRKHQEIQKIQAEIEKLKKELVEIQRKCAEISRKVYLKADLQVFQAAQEEITEYKSEISELSKIHGDYLHQIEMLRNLQVQIENLQMDLDDLRYDIRNLQKDILSHELQIAQCEEQLRLEDYEAVAAKLNYCVKRLQEIPEELQACSKELGVLESRGEYLKNEEERTEQQRAKAEEKTILWKKGFREELQLGYVEEISVQESESVMETADKCVKLLWKDNHQSSMDMAGVLQERYHAYKGEMAEFGLVLKQLFTGEEYVQNMDNSFRRLDILGKYKGKEVVFPVLVQGIKEDVEIQKNLVKESDRNLFEDILAHTISKKIRLKIYNSETWVANMNQLMGSMNTSSGLKLNLIWKKKKAEEEGQLDTRRLVELLKKDAGIMKEEELEQLSQHFQSKVAEARRQLSDTGNTKSFHGIMREILDYRKWFEFQLFYEKTGEKQKELTNNAFFTFSGGEKAMSMYVPLFSAVVAKYQGARGDAPRLISLDEAFAGVDDTNISDMFRLMVEFDFEFIINSQILWGDCDTVPSLAIYQLLRPQNAKYVSVLPYRWNGKVRTLMMNQKEVGQE